MHVVYNKHSDAKCNFSDSPMQLFSFVKMNGCAILFSPSLHSYGQFTGMVFRAGVFETFMSFCMSYESRGVVLSLLGFDVVWLCPDHHCSHSYRNKEEFKFLLYGLS